MEMLEIHTPYIKLDQAMKLIGWVGLGSEAKLLIQSAEVYVNGQICQQRGKKLYNGDQFAWQGYEAEIREVGPASDF